MAKRARTGASSKITPGNTRSGLGGLLKTPGRIVDYANATPTKLPPDPFQYGGKAPKRRLKPA